MKNSTKILFALGVVAVISISALAWVAAVRLAVSPASPGKTVGIGVNSYLPFVSAQVVVSGATSTQVLAVDTSRFSARVQNASSTGAYCLLSSTPATKANSGLYLGASSSVNSVYVVLPSYAGALNCIGDGASTTILISQQP